MKIEDIRSKIDMVQENLDKLEILQRLSFDEFTSDFRNIDSSEHRLQVAIQALLDIGCYIISSLGLKTPSSNAEVIDILAKDSLINRKKLDVYKDMVRFRNRIVHLYNQIDIKILYGVLKDEVKDIKALFGELMHVIERYKNN